MKRLKPADNSYTVDIRNILKDLLDKFKQINSDSFEVYYKKVIVPVDTDMENVWPSFLYVDDATRSWKEYTNYPLFERKKDAKPSHIVYGALHGTNVDKGKCATHKLMRETVRLLLLREYEPDDMPDSDKFLADFAGLASKIKKTNISRLPHKVYLWYEFLLKLSEEHGSLIQADCLSDFHNIELPCTLKVQTLETDICEASILALKYLLQKAEHSLTEKPAEKGKKPKDGGDTYNISDSHVSFGDKAQHAGRDINPPLSATEKKKSGWGWFKKITVFLGIITVILGLLGFLFGDNICGRFNKKPKSNKSAAEQILNEAPKTEPNDPSRIKVNSQQGSASIEGTTMGADETTFSTEPNGEITITGTVSETKRTKIKVDKRGQIKLKDGAIIDQN